MFLIIKLRQIRLKQIVKKPEPIEAIKFRMEQQGISIKEMEGIIGKSNRVYEVLNEKRPLSLNMIRKLHDKLGISADVLIKIGA